jgi:2-polyprenyl-3-methyl-5-hydroxy-6-metoxy-1,4-benzoquinol methylase
MEKTTGSIERITPHMVDPSDVTGQVALELHLQRYEFAAEYVQPGRILDIACGVGYGTHLLAEKRKDIVECIGVDVSKAAVEYAMQYYVHPRIHFQEHDAMTFTDEKGFDSIVSVETLEHVPEPGILLKHLHGLLRSGGILIASVPTTPSTDVNPYHLHDFTQRSLRNMGNKHGLKEIACLQQIQPYPLMKALKREESRMTDLRHNLMSYYFKHPMAGVKRLWSTLRYGFTNRYLTIAWQKAYVAPL